MDVIYMPWPRTVGKDGGPPYLKPPISSLQDSRKCRHGSQYTDCRLSAREGDELSKRRMPEYDGSFLSNRTRQVPPAGILPLRGLSEIALETAWMPAAGFNPLGRASVHPTACLPSVFGEGPQQRAYPPPSRHLPAHAHARSRGLGEADTDETLASVQRDNPGCRLRSSERRGGLAPAGISAPAPQSPARWPAKHRDSPSRVRSRDHR